MNKVAIFPIRKHCTFSLVVAILQSGTNANAIMVILLLLSLVITLGLGFTFIHRKCLQFRNLAGPLEWPIVGSAAEIVNLNSVDIFKLLRRYAQQYGTAYKISFWYQYTLVFAKPNVVEKILNTQSYAAKSEDYDKVAEWIGYGLLISKGEKWFKRRKVLTPGFHFKILESFLRVFNEKSDVLCRKLASFGGSEIDVFPILKLYTLDVLCETALGYSCNAQTENSFYPTAVEELMSILYWRFFNLFASVDTFFRFTKEYRRFHKLIKDTREFTLKIINQKRQLLKDEPEEAALDDDVDKRKKKMALLDLLLRATIDGKPLTDDDIREEVDTFTFAGHDTTSSALTFLLFNIAKYPEVQQKLYEEISTVVGCTTDLTLPILNDLRYLDLVIKESLRLYPSVPMIARIATEDTQLDDMPIPKGTCVSVDIFQMHRDPNWFADPECFIPERFDAVKEGGQQNSFTYIPFSAGSRNCIGQKFAQYEMKIAITKLIQAFRLELPNPDVEPVLKAEIVLKPAEKLAIRFITRNN
ncbi:probable cytochrome P450 4d14 [Armigeres subalbatus]|uniref:probable cytochrome P450 4d14 n=1 Tax=Armigeres subalbatus TaxID=124917 RepID=UPI002ED20E96